MNVGAVTYSRPSIGETGIEEQLETASILANEGRDSEGEFRTLKPKTWIEFFPTVLPGATVSSRSPDTLCAKL